MVSLARSVPSDHASLSGLRQSVSTWLNEELGAVSVVADTAVVLTELAANVIDHTDSPNIDVDLRLTAGHLTLHVANEGPMSEVPAVDMWGRLAEADRGRGLRLVRALCDEVLVDGDDHRTEIICRLRLA